MNGKCLDSTPKGIVMLRKQGGENARRNVNVPSFESLERRELLSGDVTALSSAGTFYLYGDLQSNSVVVTNPTPGNFHIAGAGGTTVNGGASADVTGITGATVASMSLGDDSVEFQSANLPGPLMFFGSLGNNTLILGGSGSAVHSFLNVFNSIGNDTVTVSDTAITGSVYIDNSLGTNTTSFTDGSIGTSLTAYSPAGRNSLSLDGTPVGSYLYEYNGYGTGTTTLTDSNVGSFLYLYNVGGLDIGGANAGFSTATTVHGGTINGSVTLLNVLGADKTTFTDATVHGSFYEDNSLGAATTSITGGTIDHGVTLIGLGGADTFTLGSAAGPTAFGSSLFVWMGESADALTVRGLTVAGNTTIWGGGGANTIAIDGSTFTGTTGITTGFGADTLNIEQVTDSTGGTTFTARLTINTGAGNDTVKFGRSGEANCFVHFVTGFSLDGGLGTDTVDYIGNGNIMDAGVTITIINVENGLSEVLDLGTAGNFVILTKSGISTTGTTAIDGDIGVSPIAATGITGFDLVVDASGEFSKSSLVTGNVYASNYASPTPANLTTAIGDMETAYNEAAGLAAGVTGLGAGSIGGLTLAAGVYKWGTGVIIPTDVTLSGSATDVWIFQIAGTLNISSSRKVVLGGSAQAENIFWQVAGQTTLGTGAEFQGIILGKTAIVMNTGATLDGRALAQTAVTLDSNTVTAPV